MSQMPVADIVVPGNRRTLRPTASLETSMARLGQMYPILVNIQPGTPTLIAGHHRLVAARRLGWESIDVSVKDVSPDEAALMEIDDNLEHNSLDAAERCCQLAERKDIYLRLHPETKRGGKNQHTKVLTAPDAVSTDSSFVADTAAKTGMAERTIRKYVQVGEILKKSGAGELLIGTPVAGRQKELDYLAKMEPEKQRAIAGLIKSGECSGVYEAEKAFPTALPRSATSSFSTCSRGALRWRSDPRTERSIHAAPRYTKCLPARKMGSAPPMGQDWPPLLPCLRGPRLWMGAGAVVHRCEPPQRRAIPVRMGAREGTPRRLCRHSRRIQLQRIRHSRRGGSHSAR